MRVPRLRRRDVEVSQEERHPFRSRGRSLGFAPDFTPGRFECFPADGETMLLRIAGEWRSTPPQFSMLAVKVGGRTKHFQSLPGGPQAAEPAQTVWRAAFAVPRTLVESSSRYALSAHGSWVSLPAPEILDDGAGSAVAANEAPAPVEEKAAEAREERDQALAALTSGDAAPELSRKERRALEQRASDRDRTIEGLQRELSERDEAIERLGRELVEARAQTESKATELAEARAEIESKESELAAARSDAEAKAGELASRAEELDGVRGERSELQGELESLRELVGTAQAERDASSARAEKHEGEVQALHRKANDIARELTDQTEVSTRLETELGEARNALEQHDQEIEAARADLAQTRQDLSEAASERDRLSAELEQLHNSHTGDQETLAGLRDELEAARARIHELEQRVTETREALRIGVSERLWGGQGEAADQARLSR